MTDEERRVALIRGTRWWDAERLTEQSRLWEKKYRRWIKRVKPNQWEALARQGESASSLQAYRDEIAGFLIRESEGEDDGEAPTYRRGWDQALVKSLLKCFDEAAKPQKSKLDDDFQLAIFALPDETRNELMALNRLQQAREFVACVVQRAKVSKGEFQ